MTLCFGLMKIASMLTFLRHENKQLFQEFCLHRLKKEVIKTQPLALGLNIFVWQDLETGEKVSPGQPGNIMIKTNSGMIEYLNR